jgi:hypothetical protein
MPRILWRGTILGPVRFLGMRDTPEPTKPERPVAEFRTPRDGRRRAMRAIGNELRVLYAGFVKETLPRRISDLMRRIDGIGRR